MIDLKTKLARAAWDLGPTSKITIPTEILHELIKDFTVQHDIEVLTIEELEVLKTFTVVIKGQECIELYSDWMQTFEDHGYEPPFLVVDNGV